MAPIAAAAPLGFPSLLISTIDDSFPAVSPAGKPIEPFRFHWLANYVLRFGRRKHASSSTTTQW